VSVVEREQEKRERRTRHRGSDARAPIEIMVRKRVEVIAGQRRRLWLPARRAVHASRLYDFRDVPLPREGVAERRRL
jgi:hypothetical protein